MDLRITASVGAGGTNRQPDVRIVQSLLNKAHPSWGGPVPKLAEDGLIGPKTIAAIRKLQQAQFATIFTPDSKVDPNGRTLRRLNHMAGSREVPGASPGVDVGLVQHLRQPTNMVCWATAATMLMSARDRVSYEIRTAMGMADGVDPAGGYLNMFNTNQGLPPARTGAFTRAGRLKVGPAASFAVPGFAQLMRSHGALGIVALPPFLHIRVITKLSGDGTVFGTIVHVLDPGKNQPYDEVFQTFAERYEAAAGINASMDQIWHK
jgi:peptidoglycan hydrolase-like protein with peptidoglycan-binding domain